MYNQYDNFGMYNNMGFYNSIPKKNINWSNILNGTQKTLGIINQAIPIFYQMRPLLNNARTLFKIAGAINSKDDNETERKSPEYNYNNYNYQKEKDSNMPTFFL